MRKDDELNFKTRKRELALIRENQAKLQAFLKKTRQEKQHQQEQEKRQKDAEKFMKTASSMHHLVSTKSVSGVYNPPHLPLETNRTQRTTSVMAGGQEEMPVENTLRSIARKSARESLRGKRKSRNRNLTATHKNLSVQYSNSMHMLPSEKQGMQPLNKSQLEELADTTLSVDPRDSVRTNPNKRLGPFLPQHKLVKRKHTTYDTSVLRSSTYQYKEDLDREEGHLNKLTRISPQPFVTCSKPNEKLMYRSGPSIRSCDRDVPTPKKKKLVSFKPKIRSGATFDRKTMPDIGIQSAPRTRA